MILFIILIILSFVKAEFSGWIDPDTKTKYRKIKSFSNGIIYDIIMSDEFNIEGRSFKDGDDPTWTALDKSDDDQTSSGKKSLQYYNSTNVYTKNGSLVIETNDHDTKWKGYNPYKKKYTTMSRHFKSGMVQSWNKFCYTGGILELDVKFPGAFDVGGLWPAAWIMGNLGRATYEASTNKMWPWSYEKCDRNLQSAQEISGCDITSHYSLKPGQGRGATEIDIIEVMAGPSDKLPIVKHIKRPYTSMTLQVAPGIPIKKKRPFTGTLPEWGFHWYPNISYGYNVSINPFFYGTYLSSTNVDEPISRSSKEEYQCDAISSMMNLDKSYFETMHSFRLEWQPGDEGYVHWYVDGIYRFGIEAASLKEEAAKIPNEPSYVILNTAISTSWGFPATPQGCDLFDCKLSKGKCGFNAGFCDSLPAHYAIDHIRIYQNKNDSSHTMGCNPKEYPTKDFIKAHEYRYKLPTQMKSLKEIVIGGGSCNKDNDCGVNNNCIKNKCKCIGIWVGPQCKVPYYKNDFKDWQDDNWSFFSIQWPFIPSFLVYSSYIIILLLFIAAYIVNKNKINNNEFVNMPIGNERPVGWL